MQQGNGLGVYVLFSFLHFMNLVMSLFFSLALQGKEGNWLHACYNKLWKFYNFIEYEKSKFLSNPS